MCVLGVEGSEKKCGPPSPEDNFWNSPNVTVNKQLHVLTFMSCFSLVYLHGEPVVNSNSYFNQMMLIEMAMMVESNQYTGRINQLIDQLEQTTAVIITNLLVTSNQGKLFVLEPICIV